MVVPFRTARSNTRGIIDFGVEYAGPFGLGTSSNRTLRRTIWSGHPRLQPGIRFSRNPVADLGLRLEAADLLAAAIRPGELDIPRAAVLQRARHHGRLC